MILTCPACSTRYNIEGATLGDEPRKVKCARCDHEWLTEPTADTSAETPPLPPEANVPEAETPASTPAQKQPNTLRIALFVAGLVVLMLFSGLLIFKNALMKSSPTFAAFYTAVGMADAEDDSPFKGLEITEIERNTLDQAGFTTLVFTGQVVNTTQAEMPVPHIQVELFDEKGILLDYWKVKPEQRSLKPQGTTQWSCRFYNAPIDEIASFEVSFAGE